MTLLGDWNWYPPESLDRLPMSGPETAPGFPGGGRTSRPAGTPTLDAA